jgi:hypothetical protein
MAHLLEERATLDERAESAEEQVLSLRAACSRRELELLELQREHALLTARFGEAQENYEEALDVRHRPPPLSPPRALSPP